MNTENIPFELKVLLGTSTLSKSDLGKMEVGDVLILDQKVENPLSIQIGREKIEGFAGIYKHLKAVQIQ